MIVVIAQMMVLRAIDCAGFWGGMLRAIAWLRSGLVYLNYDSSIFDKTFDHTIY